ncbi:HPr family phosphocarrier protein [Candidatus Sumerlaeota bacterium]|nr:HPr family phosphocarrier protein [Candidatus Sumerlaeota bacterium]
MAGRARAHTSLRGSRRGIWFLPRAWWLVQFAAPRRFRLIPEGEAVRNLSSADKTKQNAEAHRATVKIRNRLGLHLRPASRLVKTASQFTECEISLSKDGQQVNAKSIMGVIMLAAEQGSELTLEATGKTAAEAIAELTQLIESGFGED